MLSKVHLLWTGKVLDTGFCSFIRNAARICSPVVDKAVLHDHLEPRTCPGADGTLFFQGGKLVEGSRGIVFLNTASMSPANLQRLHCYTRDCTSAPKNKIFVSAPRIPNTATCWMLAETDAMLGPKESPMEALQVATGGLVLPHIDLVVKAGSDDEDRTIDSILGIDDGCSTPCYNSADATAQIRDHLLKSCAMDPPAMYVFTAFHVIHTINSHSMDNVICWIAGKCFLHAGLTKRFTSYNRTTVCCGNRVQMQATSTALLKHCPR